jgi:DNA-binding beta-propeller fold protein YncE
MRRLTALLTLLLPMLAGCSSRAHLNPFDPENPQTGGRPAGFAAIAGDRAVLLRWQAASSPQLLGYQVFRLAPGDTAFLPVTGLLPSNRTSVVDFSLLNGDELRYRLYFVFDRGLGGLPAEDVATPGPLVPWVADYGGGSLVRLSADGRHIAASLQPADLSRPVVVDVNPADGKVWSVGVASGVLVYDPNTTQQALIGEGLTQPVSVAVDRKNGSAWVGDAGSATVVHLQPWGAPADPPALSGLDYPGSLALDRANGSLWVVEQDGDLVHRYDAQGALAATAALTRPSQIAVDTLTHEAWVTSFASGRVVRLSPNGTALDTVTACRGPIGIAVDATRRRIWVADAVGDQVVALARDGTVQFQIRGLPEARQIVVDESTGEAWVTLTAAGAVARLSPGPREVLRVGGMIAPWGIALDDLRERVGTMAASPEARPPAGGAAVRRIAPLTRERVPHRSDLRHAEPHRPRASS